MAYALTVASEVENGNDPDSHKEAMALMDACKWLRSMREDMSLLRKIILGLL